jgi:FemAB-related protein (PEP-CTERM system-associated)
MQPLEKLAVTESSFSIESAGAESRSAWDACVAAHPSGTFYHLFDWKNFHEQECGHQCDYLLARAADGGLRGVLPLVYLRSRLFGRILCSMPYVNYGGPVAADAAVAAALAQRAAARAGELGADYLELRCNSPLETAMEASLRKVSMTIALKPDAEELFKGFTSKHRTNIRRAQKNGLTVTAGGAELLPVFYELMRHSWRSLGTPLYSRDFFARVLATFPQYTRLFVCSHQGTPIAATFNGEFNGIVEGMWAAALPQFRHLQPNYVLYWEMIRDACERGFRHFHLGRSTADSGAEQFKSKWTAEARQLYWYFHRPDGGAMPALNVDNPKYKLAIAAWQRAPLWFTGMLGPSLARGIP